MSRPSARIAFILPLLTLLSSCMGEGKRMLGSAYRDMGESPKALESFQLAVEAGDTTSSNYDVDYLMRIHSQMSELYLKQRLLDATHSIIKENMKSV